MTPEDRDAYAGELIDRVVRPLALILRGHGPDAMVARWRELPPGEQEATVALLAGAYPVEEPDANLFAWLRRAKVRPDRGDEYSEAPRPLVHVIEGTVVDSPQPLVVGALVDERYLPTGRRSRGWS